VWVLFAFTNPAPSTAALQVECGFENHVKGQEWFTVRVEPVPVGSQLDVFVMTRSWVGNQKESYPVARFIGTHHTNRPSAWALCQYPESYGNEYFVRCQVTHADGAVTSRDVQPNLLSGSGNRMVLAVTDTPERFDFIGGIVRPERGIIRVTSRLPSDVPDLWQSFDPLDLVILDCTNLVLRPEQQTALGDWVSGGGTVLFTSRTLETRPQQVLPVAGPLTRSRRSHSYPAPVFTNLLGRKCAFVNGVQAFPLEAPGFTRILGDGSDTLLAARDVGYGRILATGLVWDDFELKDRASLDLVRETLVSRLLDLIRPIQTLQVGRTLVLPEEARAAYLMKPLLAFLVVFVLIAGPLNWLVLKWRRRMEWNVVTLPAIAIVFSLGAFLIGWILRTADPVLHEAEIVRISGNRSVLTGLSGLLSPDRSSYTLAIANPTARLAEQLQNHGEERNPDRRQIPIFQTSPAPSLSGVRIQTWAMRFFHTRQVLETGGFTAWATPGPSNLNGQVRNDLPFDLQDCHVIHGGNRLSVGDLPSGAGTGFQLPLSPPGRQSFALCPNCRSFHGGHSWYSREYCKTHPLPEPLRQFLDATQNLAPMDPVLVGWQTTSAPTLVPDRNPFRLVRRRLVVVPIRLDMDGPTLSVPAGLAVPVRLRENRSPFTAAHCQYIPYALDVGEPDSWDRDPAAPRRPSPDPFDPEGMADPDREERLSQVTDFYLPFEAETLRGRRLTVHWDAGEADPDTPPAECTLSLYDWSGRSWQELCRARDGEHAIQAENPDRFVRLPHPIVRVRVRAEPGAGQQKQARPSVASIDISYEGDRGNTPGGGQP
jgi:hypothetical protein